MDAYSPLSHPDLESLVVIGEWASLTESMGCREDATVFVKFHLVFRYT